MNAQRLAQILLVNSHPTIWEANPIESLDYDGSLAVECHDMGAGCWEFEPTSQL